MKRICMTIALALWCTAIATAATGGLGREAWDVLRQALVEESMSEKYYDFSEGAGAEPLKRLSQPAYIALMRELANAPQARVRRRAIASLAKVSSDEATRIISAALKDKALGVRLEAASILGARGNRSVIPILARDVKIKNRDDRFLILQYTKKIPAKWVVNLMRSYLADSDPFIRVSACDGLCKLGDEKAYVALRQAMKDADKYVRCSAYAVAQESPRALALMHLALQDHDAQNRIFAAVFLARKGNPDGLHALKAALGPHTPPTLRYTVVDALATLSERRAVPMLRLALADEDAQVRLRAAEALLSQGDTSAWHVVEQAMQSPQSSVRLKAVGAARVAPAGGGLNLLLAALWDRARGVRMAAVDTLASLPRPEKMDVVQKALASEECGTRVAAAVLLARLGSGDSLSHFVAVGAKEREEALRALESSRAPRLVSYLQQMVGDGTDAERARAIAALSRQKEAAAAVALQQIALSPAPLTDDLRVAAVQGLGKVGADSALLRPLLEGPKAVRTNAAVLLGERGDHSVVAALKQAADSGDVRAARVLCTLGDDSGATVYRQVLGSPNLTDRIQAAVELYRLDPSVGTGE